LGESKKLRSARARPFSQKEACHKTHGTDPENDLIDRMRKLCFCVNQKHSNATGEQTENSFPLFAIVLDEVPIDTSREFSLPLSPSGKPSHACDSLPGYEAAK
jgi:hypothetical protein